MRGCKSLFPLVYLSLQNGSSWKEESTLDPTDSRMFLLRLDAGGKHPMVQCSGGMGDLFPPQLEL